MTVNGSGQKRVLLRFNDRLDCQEGPVSWPFWVPRNDLRVWSKLTFSVRLVNWGCVQSADAMGLNGMQFSDFAGCGRKYTEAWGW